MKWVGGLPWFAPGEIDQIVDDELDNAGHPLLGNGVATDVEKFIEAHLGIQPDLRDLPEGVQGATKFSRTGKAEIWMDAKLFDRSVQHDGARHRTRSTLAHEAGHVILHSAVYIEDGIQDLFRPPLETGPVLCRTGSIGYGGSNTDKLEWQANQAMGALLMPRGRFTREIQALRVSMVPESKMAPILAERFDVSEVAASIRMGAVRVNTAQKEKLF
jgi:hypothetical protein